MITWLAEDIEGLLSAEEIQEFFSHPVRMNAGFQYSMKFINIFILKFFQTIRIKYFYRLGMIIAFEVRVNISK